MSLDAGVKGGPSVLPDGFSASGTLSLGSAARPIMMARMSSSPSIPDNTPTRVAYDTALIDTHSGFNTTFNYYKIPVSGIYEVYAIVVPDGSAFPILSMRVNSVQVATNQQEIGISGIRYSVQFTYLYNFKSGDIVEMYYHHNSGAARVLRGVAHSESAVFQIVKSN